MDAAGLDEAERLRRQKAAEDVPPLPPLLAQILAETRAKQAAKAAGKDAAAAGGEGGAKEAGDDEAKPAKGPLFLEAPPPPGGLIVQGTDVPAEHGVERDSEEDEDQAAPEQPPGPIDASRCRAHGPGFSGASACQPVKLTITARDSAGKRIREGGAHILVLVEPTAAPGAAEEPEPIQAEVVDHGDGTYTASYAVPTKGNYQLHIEVNGDPLGESPYPIFFSAAQPVPQAAAQPAGMAAAAAAAAAPGVQPLAGVPGMAMPVPTMTAGGIQIVTAEAIKAAQQQQAAAVAGAVQAAVPGAPGAAAAAMAAAYPNLATGVQISLLKSVFAFCGSIRGCTLAGANTGCAFLEFGSPQEATAALAMSGVSLMGQPLKVELASEAKKAADAAATTVANPYMALQAHQVQQFRLLQQQQTALAEQVLNMRAAARGRPVPASAAAAAPNYHSNDSQNRSRERKRRDRSRSRERGHRGHKERKHHKHSRRDREERRRSRSRDRGDGKRNGSKAAEEAGAGPQKMDVDVVAPAPPPQPPPPQQQQEQPKGKATDELEALLEELGE
ncbi:expressed protein [Chlorella variabilis]|uniref:Expressed protein n=1 Tax=Chlorella variabilis TaxID=554065 RepID=E1ZAC5_CHLVA|nr:expressed protein [Chlorella variabilis]EFN57239.1 expressed protein [Chlorella variabilis]|eukprot:XP_005849341.1 expressed protein [Chlorella variabilis]